MADLINQGKTAGKLVEFGMLQNIAEDDSQHKNDYKTLFQGQGKILLALSDNDDLSQKDLVDRLNMTPQSVAEFVRKLEGRGLVSRKKSTTDKRVTIVSLTKEGRLETEKRMQVIPRFLRALNDEELLQFNNILDKINEQMYLDIKNADPTLQNKYHQMMLNHVMTKIRDDKKEL
ncbi:transcriptional regulator [Companilactobacillus mindensis DSM 14500]|uniref:Transcriptional regulator n=1 Tax=Companilactobacillus mindensis DSM 14500 TaxID=1423770 RepID=A0A0R1QRD4_9LACO|nr:MarR family transcriptional regulator [Companilactobacillus mindensis]KRL44789.1 transcriptional regulator [Companilactobacillus mindensis DSM 14500]GEO78032.1 MarR family transcriptional regulator [Companilactobacillus mindensis]